MSFDRTEQTKASDHVASSPFDLPMAHELRQISTFANNASKADSQRLVKGGVLPDVQFGKESGDGLDWKPSPLEQAAKSIADTVLGFDDWLHKQSGAFKQNSDKAMHDIHDGFLGHGY